MVTTDRLGLEPAELRGLVDYLERLVKLDDRAAVRLQGSGGVLGVWSGPPFDVLALKPVATVNELTLDATVSAQRLLERLRDSLTESTGEGGLVAQQTVALPDRVPGPNWVGLLAPRSGWQERGRDDVANVRAAVDTAKHFFRLRADGVTDRAQLEQIANDVWERACLAEVPVRAAHAAESLGLLGPGNGEVVAYATDSWLRLAAPGGSVASRRGFLPSLPLFPLT